MFAAGLFQKNENHEQFLLGLNAVSSNSNEERRLKILKLEDIKGAFIILLFGYSLSSIVLFIEIVIKRYFTKANISLVKKRRKIWKKM